MSSRNYVIAVVALATVGSGLWWVLSNRTRQGQSIDTHPDSEEVIEVSEPEPPIASTPAQAEGEVAAVKADDAPVVDVPPAPVVWPASALAFSKQDDPDPTLSRYLEAEVQRFIDTTLDRAKYDATSVTCRGNRCQMLAIDRTLAADPKNVATSRDKLTAGPPTTAFVATILRGASNAGMRNPTTGASLKAQLEMLQIAHNEPSAVEFIIAFAGP